MKLLNEFWKNYEPVKLRIFREIETDSEIGLSELISFFDFVIINPCPKKLYTLLSSSYFRFLNIES